MKNVYYVMYNQIFYSLNSTSINNLYNINIVFKKKQSRRGRKFNLCN